MSQCHKLVVPSFSINATKSSLLVSHVEAHPLLQTSLLTRHCFVHRCSWYLKLFALSLSPESHCHKLRLCYFSINAPKSSSLVSRVEAYPLLQTSLLTRHCVMQRCSWYLNILQYLNHVMIVNNNNGFVYNLQYVYYDFVLLVYFCSLLFLFIIVYDLVFLCLYDNDLTLSCTIVSAFASGAHEVGHLTTSLTSARDIMIR